MTSIKSPSSVMRETGGTLSHYGVKGMKWGVRRSDAQLAAAPTRAPRMSEDARTATRLQDKADFKGTGTLSNHEMRQLLERMDLERRYDQAIGTPSGGSNPIDRGHDQVKKILAYGQTYEKARKFMETPTGKAVKTGVKAAAAAGFAYATGGAGPAAAAAGTSLIRRNQ